MLLAAPSFFLLNMPAARCARSLPPFYCSGCFVRHGLLHCPCLLGWGHAWRKRPKRPAWESSCWRFAAAERCGSHRSPSLEASDKVFLRSAWDRVRCWACSSLFSPLEGRRAGWGWVVRGGGREGRWGGGRGVVEEGVLEAYCSNSARIVPE